MTEVKMRFLSMELQRPQNKTRLRDACEHWEHSEQAFSDLFAPTRFALRPAGKSCPLS